MSSNKVIKKHAMYTSPVHPNMQSFSPLDGVDLCYGQLFCPINHDTYTFGSAEGFLPHNPFKDFKFCPDAMCEATAFLAKSCTSSILFPVMHCLVDPNDWLRTDQDNDRTREEPEIALFSPNSPCLNS